MKAPKFSVIIPTRNRHDTLSYTLQTVVKQGYDDYELVVCDNNSTPETKDVVMGVQSPNIRYVRSDKDLTMSDNWEFALSNAQGEYILLVGDDDGLLPYTFQELEQIITVTKSSVIRSSSVTYNWPLLFPESLANQFVVPCYQPHKLLNGKEAIRKVLQFEMNYAILPLVYNSAIHRDIFSALRQKTGRVFHSQIPDVYSGYAIASVAGYYVSIGKPLFIRGRSHHSNGMAHKYQRHSQQAQEFSTLNSQSSLQWSPYVPHLPRSVPAFTLEPFFQAKIHLFEHDKTLSLDRKSVLQKILRNRMWVASEEEWSKNIAYLKEWVGNDRQLQAYLDKELSTYTPNMISDSPSPQYRMGFSENIFTHGGKCLVLDASRFGVSDVYGASLLAQDIVGENLLTFETLRSIKKQMKATLSSVTPVQKLKRLLTRIKRVDLCKFCNGG